MLHPRDREGCRTPFELPLRPEDAQVGARSDAAKPRCRLGGVPWLKTFAVALEPDFRQQELTRQQEVSHAARPPFVPRCHPGYCASGSAAAVPKAPDYELTTRINVVIAFAEILNEEHFGPVNDRQREYLPGI